MTASSWRSTAMATSARSIAWHAADRCYVSVLNINPRAYEIVVRVTKSGRRCALLHATLLSLGGAILASCAGEQPPPPPETAAVQPEQPAPTVSPPRHPVPRPARKPAPPAAAEGPAPEAGDQALAMIAPEPAGVSPGPAVAALPQAHELIGMDQPAATRLLGAPAEQTEEPPATVWRYKTATCELDLFFYLDLRSGRMRTLRYAFKDEATDSARHQNCLRELAAARGG